MKQDQLKSAYNKFFNKSDEGKYFMAYIYNVIDTAHQSAETSPELAAYYSQKAKGAREILHHIQSVTTEVKKGKAA